MANLILNERRVYLPGSRSIFHLLVYHVEVKKNGTRCGMLGHETNRILPILFMGAMLTPCWPVLLLREERTARNSAEMTTLPTGCYRAAWARWAAGRGPGSAA